MPRAARARRTRPCAMPRMRSPARTRATLRGSTLASPASERIRARSICAGGAVLRVALEVRGSSGAAHAPIGAHRRCLEGRARARHPVVDGHVEIGAPGFAEQDRAKDRREARAVARERADRGFLLRARRAVDELHEERVAKTLRHRWIPRYIIARAITRRTS